MRGRIGTGQLTVTSFAVPESPGWSTLDHGRDSILVPDGFSLVPDHGHNDSALVPAHVAFQMEDLLPRAWNELAMSGCDTVIANFSHGFGLLGTLHAWNRGKSTS